MFGRNENTVPDVGGEDAYEQATGGNNFSGGEATDAIAEPVVEAAPQGGNVSGDLELEKVNVKIESINSWLKQFYERFSTFSG